MKKPTFKAENWNKGTPVKWRNIGDLLLILGQGINGIVISLPIPPQAKIWIIASSTLLTTAGKFLTKLFSDE